MVKPGYFVGIAGLRSGWFAVLCLYAPTGRTALGQRSGVLPGLPTNALKLNQRCWICLALMASAAFGADKLACITAMQRAISLTNVTIQMRIVLLVAEQSPSRASCGGMAKL